MPIPPDKPRAIRLSNRQYALLDHLNHARNGTLSIEQLASLNQLTLGANKRRKWLIETPKRDGVRITPEGRDVLQSFFSADFVRQVASMKFSSFLSQEVYEPEAEPHRSRKKRNGDPR